MITNFKKSLERKELSKNTISAYVQAVNSYFINYSTVTKENLVNHKIWLIENFHPSTVNVRLQGMNRYLEFKKQNSLKMKFVKMQQRTFCENVISNAEYVYLKKQLKKAGLMGWYFIVWFLTATGARISELLQIQTEHVEKGYMDIYTKGGKIRRLYIPKSLRINALQWLYKEGIMCGFIFQNHLCCKFAKKKVARCLKNFAKKYGLNQKVIYPHSFRHRFAKNFLQNFNDIALLSDLLGHKCIETTRIYLRRTLFEQQTMVDKIVTW
ncbi:MAG: tyrosine-type recombinase/integrase [Prevotellaceae bacterium]|jgi:site-specific recombinase XerD|nr:tyrosine-type recombinase/integrase [Prevotellaceae bacterium]